MAKQICVATACWCNQLQNGEQSWKPVFEIAKIIWAIS